MERYSDDNPVETTNPGFYVALGVMVALLTIMVLWVASQQSGESLPGGQGAGPARTQAMGNDTVPRVMPPTPSAVIATDKVPSKTSVKQNK